MNRKGYIVIVPMLVIGVLSALGLSQTKWNNGYEEAIYVQNAEPWDTSYLPIPGMEDKKYWDRSYPLGQAIYERSKYLADKVGYEGDDIACSHDGRYLYIGVDPWDLTVK
ncbi:MAG TPA: hypothetical protein VMV86_01110 [Methanosarcinales archaeon]|nr:hypothetical protein [Methanosarcinales archaeon]